MSCARKRSRSGCFRHERLELADELLVAAEPEHAVSTLRNRDQATLLETVDLTSDERLQGDVGEDRASPESERGVVGAKRPLEVPVGRSRASVGSEPLEAAGIQLVRGDHGDVTGSTVCTTGSTPARTRALRSRET